MNEYMDNIHVDMDKLKIEMNKCFDIYTILDKFKYRFTKEDMDKKWLIYGFPFETQKLIEKRQTQLEKDKIKFCETQKQEQEDFKNEIENMV